MTTATTTTSLLSSSVAVLAPSQWLQLAGLLIGAGTLYVSYNRWQLDKEQFKLRQQQGEGDAIYEQKQDKT